MKSLQTPFVVVDGDARNLPASPLAYSAVDVVVAPAGILAENTGLRQWVESGGLLVVPSAPPADSRVLTLVSGRPVTFDQPLGLGRIVYTQSLSALTPDAWRDMLETCAADDDVIAGLRRTEGYYDLLARYGFGPHDSQPPTAGVLVGFLGLYVVMLVPVNYVVLRRLRRKELAWATVPALVVVFSFVAYFMGAGRMSKGLAVRRLSVTETAANSSRALWTGRAMLFSPSKKRYSIEFAGRAISAADIRDDFDRSAFPPLTVVEDEGALRLPTTEVFMWSTRRFMLNGMSDLGGRVIANLTTDGSVVRGTIRNDLPVTLKGCALYGDRLVHKVGDLRPGQTVSVAVALKEIPVPPSTYRSYTDPERQSARQRLETLIEGRLLTSARRGMPEVCMLGWMDGAPYEMKVNGRVPASDDGSALIVRIRPEWRPGSGNRVAGVIPPESRPVDGDGTVLRYRVPYDGTRFAISDAILLSTAHQVSSDQGKYSIESKLPLPGSIAVSLYDQRYQRWRPVGVVRNCGRIAFRIPDPQAALGAGSIVKVRVSSSLGRSDFTYRPFKLSFTGQLK